MLSTKGNQKEVKNYHTIYIYIYIFFKYKINLVWIITEFTEKKLLQYYVGFELHVWLLGLTWFWRINILLYFIKVYKYGKID